MLPPLSAALALVVLFPAGDTPAAGEALDAERRFAVVEELGSLLVDAYVFEEVAEDARGYLRLRARSGAYFALEDREDFARALTEDLRAVSLDQHLRVTVRPPERAELEVEDPIAARLGRSDRMRQENYGFAALEILEGNVGYVDLRAFRPLPEARDTAAAAMSFLANADAIVFDLRRNGGGDPATVQFLCSYFFGSPTHLNSLYFREGDRTVEFWTLDELPGPRLPDVPLFVLTSEETFSGAEEFAYNLRTRERATLVGARTRGGANPGRTLWIDAGFEAFVPTGRAVNPVTGVNWEGVGVEPHLEVPGKQALEVALPLAREAAEAWRGRRADDLARWRTIRELLDSADEAFEDGASGWARELLHTGLQAGVAQGLLDEGSINGLGYRRLQDGRLDAALGVFGFNVRLHPESANVWDSLGEAHMGKGDFDEAVRHYERSIELDPENENAREMIELMRGR